LFVSGAPRCEAAKVPSYDVDFADGLLAAIESGSDARAVIDGIADQTFVAGFQSLEQSFSRRRRRIVAVMGAVQRFGRVLMTSAAVYRMLASRSGIDQQLSRARLILQERRMAD